MSITIATPNPVIGPSPVPPPQSVQGVLHHLPSSFALYKDVLPGNASSMSTILSRPMLSFSFPYKVGDLPGTALTTVGIEPSTSASALDTAPAGKIIPWAWPTASATYISGDIILSFWAVKPAMCTGRLLIEYNPSGITFDDSLRHVLKEWDFAETDFCQVKICGFQHRRYRQLHPVTLPYEKETSSQSARDSARGGTFGFYDYENIWGAIRVSVGSQLQVGSIFPNEINCFAFCSFTEDSTVHTIRGLPLTIPNLLLDT
jgi:hypothetical protein